MGCRIAYKASRGGDDAGAGITDPEKFFAALFDSVSFLEYQAAFNALPADKQAEFLAVFNGEV